MSIGAIGAWTALLMFLGGLFGSLLGLVSDNWAFAMIAPTFVIYAVSQWRRT